MTKLVASSVVRGDHPDNCIGGLFLVNLEEQSLVEALKLDDKRIDWSNRGREFGPRGIAVDRERLYVAGSDELFAFSPTFELIESWRNPYLKHCRGIAVYERKLFITSAGYDSVIAFDLDSHEFDWALQILKKGLGFGAHPYDPRTDEGPIMLEMVDLRDVYCDATGMYLTVEGGLLRFLGRSINVAVELPPGARNARPFRNGVLFNDSLAGVLRYAERGEGEEERALYTPSYSFGDLINEEWCQDELARSGFPRGLCLINDAIVACGSSPAAVNLYDLAGNELLASVRLTMDARSAIHSIAGWPF